MSRMSPTLQFPAGRRVAAAREPAQDRISDCWPDWGSEYTDAETRAYAERNKPSAVLRDVLGILFSAALSVGLITLFFSVLPIR